MDKKALLKRRMELEKKEKEEKKRKEKLQKRRKKSQKQREKSEKRREKRRERNRKKHKKLRVIWASRDKKALKRQIKHFKILYNKIVRRPDDWESNKRYFKNVKNINPNICIIFGELKDKYKYIESYLTTSKEKYEIYNKDILFQIRNHIEDLEKILTEIKK